MEPDAFVAELTPNSLLWQRGIGGALGADVALDKLGNIFLTGEALGSFEVGTTHIFLKLHLSVRRQAEQHSGGELGSSSGRYDGH